MTDAKSPTTTERPPPTAGPFAIERDEARGAPFGEPIETESGNARTPPLQIITSEAS